MKPKKEFPLSKVYQLMEPSPVVMVTTQAEGKPNIMTMAWHMMVDFEPPLIACVLGSQAYSFKAIKSTKECVINIPTADLAQKIVGVGSCTGSKIHKFKKFKFTTEQASQVDVPMIRECFANLECKVVDTKMVAKYNIFILEVVKAWISPSKKIQRTLHHRGNGLFMVDGRSIKLPFKSN